MKKLIFLSIAMLSFQSFAFNSEDDSYQIGNYKVKSCKIFIPNLGSSTSLVKAQLKSKGFIPIVDNRIAGIGRSNAIIFFGTMTEKDSLHADKSIQGNAFLTVEAASSPVILNTTLQLKIIGEKGMEPLFESNDRTIISFDRDNDVTMYSADEFPEC